MAEETKLKLAWPPIGQDKVSAFLEKSLFSGQVAPVYIFSGPRDLGKSSLALAFARNLWRHDRQEDNKNDDFSSLTSDLFILEPEPDKKQIGIEQVRTFIKRLSLSSFLDSYKIGIIKEAGLLSAEAQNALLKTLEEPRGKTVIIILVEDVSVLIPTIISRSQVLYFYPVSADLIYDYLLLDDNAGRSLAKELSAAALGRPLQARHWLENPGIYQERLDLVKKLFSFVEMSLSDRLSFIASMGELSVKDVLLWVDIWEGLWRDALLITLNQEDRLQYPALLSDWRRYLAGRRNEDNIFQSLSSLKHLQQAREYLQGFINPKNILESLAIYF